MSRFDVTLNSVSMSSLADEIIIRDIIEEPVEQEIYKSKRSIYPGQRVSRTVRRALTVRVVYVIRSRSITRRAEIRDKIAAWAKDGGTLRVNYRMTTKTTTDGYTYTEGKQLTHVELDESPALDSSLKWTQDLQLSFTSYTVPYWENLMKLGIKFVVDTMHSVLPYYVYSGSAYCSSTAPKTPVTLQITNTSNSTLTYLNIQVGTAPNSTHFTFNGLSIAAGSSMYVEYTEEDLLRIRNSDYASLMAYRTATSDDDLMLSPGSNTIAFFTNTPVEGYLFYRERYV